MPALVRMQKYTVKSIQYREIGEDELHCVSCALAFLLEGAPVNVIVFPKSEIAMVKATVQEKTREDLNLGIRCETVE